MRGKRTTAAVFAVALLGGGVVACSDEPSCPAGQVAEYDDDGWECEPDEDGDGRDDEGSDSSSVWKTKKTYKKPTFRKR